MKATWGKRIDGEETKIRAENGPDARRLSHAHGTRDDTGVGAESGKTRLRAR